MIYFINYGFGVHRVNIKTTKCDFFNVIDDLSGELVIHKNEDDKSINYFVENYCGDLSYIGTILKEK